MNSTLTAKAYSLFDTLAWIACLNLLWLVFSLLGLFFFGVGPSTVAAHDLVRRRVRGDVFPPLRTFWRSYRQNFIRGNALGLPVLLVGAMLAVNWVNFSAHAGFAPQFISVVVLVLALLFAATVCYMFPLYVRYELPVLHYVSKSSKFALTHLAGTVLLLVVTVAIGYASLRLPGLIPFFSFGAWFYVVGWLCDKFFEQNDASVAAAENAADVVRGAARG
ncbi:MAG: DUF624 domain-containing protein [Acidobacteria bacterium]|nr:DUF624 domain-containing protein [Acidobacteriota bacterium]